MNEFLKSISKKSYKAYLIFKIIKSILAIPMFILMLILEFLCAILIVIFTAIKIFFEDYIFLIPERYKEFWSRKWFYGFSKKYWESIYENKISNIKIMSGPIKDSDDE